MWAFENESGVWKHAACDCLDYAVTPQLPAGKLTTTPPPLSGRGTGFRLHAGILGVCILMYHDQRAE